jgi:hypothetical protein
VAELDFTAALGRLLRDGRLRDSFAADPGAVTDALRVANEDRAAVRALVPDELEVQAEILLRKRFGLIRPFLPETCRMLDDRAWPAFCQYARVHWADAPWSDAAGYCEDLVVRGLIPRDLRERRRANFVSGRAKFQMWLVKNFSAAGKTRRSILILFRATGGTWRELAVCIRL